MCKMISPGVFFQFESFDFFALLEGSNSKKWPKMTKISVYCTLHFRNCKSYDLIYGTLVCIKGKHLRDFFCFFCFSKFWFLRSLGWKVGGKRAKMTQNHKKFCLSHSVSQEPFILWLWFLVCIPLCIRNCRSYHQDFDKNVYRCLSLYFLKIYNIVNIKIIVFFIHPFQQLF